MNGGQQHETKANLPTRDARHSLGAFITIKKRPTMLLSMTGFGTAVVQLPNKKITVDIKTLNSKQFDLSCRIPFGMRGSELTMRSLAASKLERGKADLTVTAECAAGATSTHLNIAAMLAYKTQFEEAATSMNIPAPQDWYSVLMRMPDVLTTEESAEDSAADADALIEATTRALDAVVEYRRVEGIKLEEFFRVRIARISDYLAEISKYESERIEHIKQRFVDGLEKIGNVEADSGRLEQEIFFYIEKLDINEEKQRLGQHLTYFIETMDASQPGQGKKLGFIAQEMGREINTLGSKSNHAEMQRLVIKMKDELEQIKEQVLNVM